MPIVYVWANNDDLDTLRRLKAYFEHREEAIFEGKSYRTGMSVGGRRKRIRREKINDSYVYREALNKLMCENEKYVREFEERDRYR